LLLFILLPEIRGILTPVSKTKISPQQVQHIANLANIPITDNEASSISKAFIETLEVVDQLQTINTQNTELTHQVTGLENVLREDEIEEKKMFSQAEALANAKKTHHGYFVVPRIIDKE
jgi:aspartyl-tRNA(Asn)/glutamyl-tRNA(Gln) amidotransferase subunit C